MTIAALWYNSHSETDFCLLFISILIGCKLKIEALLLFCFSKSTRQMHASFVAQCFPCSELTVFHCVDCVSASKRGKRAGVAMTRRTYSILRQYAALLSFSPLLNYMTDEACKKLSAQSSMTMTKVHVQLRGKLISDFWRGEKKNKNKM